MNNSFVTKSFVFVALLLLLILIILGWYWSREPDMFNVSERVAAISQSKNFPVATGVTTSITLAEVANTLLDKPGGYISNDIMPPSLFLDNIKNWEFGVLVQVRDLSRALRNDISRSQSQSKADPDLEIAEPQFNFDNASWILPSTESEYRKAIAGLMRYTQRMADPNDQSAQFYARADNLSEWLKLIETRLGSLSQRLSASVGQARINTDLAGEPNAAQSKAGSGIVMVKTPWLEIDDVFYEARGAAWALVHLLKAAELDFAQVLEKKNATVSLKQIIRDLEATQQTLWSPIVLNGGSFGILANHSLILASYIARANAAIIDLRLLLSQG